VTRKRYPTSDAGNDASGAKAPPDPSSLDKLADLTKRVLGVPKDELPIKEPVKPKAKKKSRR
jgi:hypothetical protein